MAFIMPLETRRRISSTRKHRYRTDPAYRLEQINRAREYRGAAPICSLDEMGDPKRGRVGAQRGVDGRFIRV